MADAPERIWLEPDCGQDERCWHGQRPDDCDEEGCGAKAVEYIRADLCSVPSNGTDLAHVLRERDATFALMLERAERAERDVHHVLSLIDWLSDCTGESLDPEGAAMVAQIRRDYTIPVSTVPSTGTIETLALAWILADDAYCAASFRKEVTDEAQRFFDAKEALRAALHARLMPDGGNQQTNQKE